MREGTLSPRVRTPVGCPGQISRWLTDATSGVAAAACASNRPVGPAASAPAVAIKPFVLGTFGPQGRTRCSGLPVQRCDVAGLVERVGAGFELLRGFERRHVTPAGSPQDFTHVVLRRRMPGT